MGVVGPSSVADGLPLLHLSPYLSPPLPFSTAVVRLVALQIQVGLHLNSSAQSAPLAVHSFNFLHFFLYFFIPGLEGGLSSQPCDLTLHQSGEARGDAAESAHPLRADSRLWKQRYNLGGLCFRELTLTVNVTEITKL